MIMLMKIIYWKTKINKNFNSQTIIKMFKIFKILKYMLIQKMHHKSMSNKNKKLCNFMKEVLILENNRHEKIEMIIKIQKIFIICNVIK